MILTYQFEPIGYLESCYKDKFGTPRQPGLAPHSIAKLKISASLQPELALDGLQGFSHIWIIFVFHQNKSARYHAKVHPPRLEGETMGLFATRTPHRPNPIGLSLVKLASIEKDTLWLHGVDLVDGTPILDVKPYLPEIESISAASGGWTEQAATKSVLKCEWGLAEEKLKHWFEKLCLIDLWPKTGKIDDLRYLVEETLVLDPRPTIYKAQDTENPIYRTRHSVRILNGDIDFEFNESSMVVNIINIRF